MKRFFKWCKEAKFGLILGAVAFVFILSISLIATSGKDHPVAKVPSSSTSISSSSNSSSTSSTTSSSTNVKEKIFKPFTVDATIARYFFDPEDSIDIKSQALISYDNKVMPSLGIDYVYAGNSFDVTASFSGKVVAKTNDPLYGLTVTVESSNGVIAYYSGLTEVNVYQDATIKQGIVLGKAGVSTINANLGNHLHFALKANGEYINPLKSYEKLVEEL